ncbi:hypothetical protein D3C79_1080010 [compost metagenome]
MGTSTAVKMSSTFIASPIPSQMMASGISASVGMARLICTSPSSKASPLRVSPDSSASSTPATTPRNSPL